MKEWAGGGGQKAPVSVGQLTKLLQRNFKKFFLVLKGFFKVFKVKSF